MEHGYTVTRADIRKLQNCIALLGLKSEKKSKVSKKLKQLESRLSKHRSHTSSPGLDQFSQKKADLVREKDNLAALVRIGKRLGEILGKMSVQWSWRDKKDFSV